ncbi:MAG: SIS domain-containing protein [Anaerolineae bacterium]|nr:SIS domain-containing protein [Anaerolineae bacterium]
MSYLHSEIHEQPDVIQRLLTEEAENVKQITQAIREAKPTFVMIAARGTSDNAARYAQYTLGIFAGMPVALATPSAHTLYGAQIDMSQAFVIGISQSGKSVDVAQIVTDARKQGAKTLSITNDPESHMAQAAEYHIWLRCGEEQSVAATKTYTAQLTALAMLTAYLVDDATMLEDLAHLPKFVAETLTNAQVINDWAERYRYIERIAVIGRGLNYSTAYEVALKIKELCYVVGEEYSEADFRHGPIAIISRGFPVLVIAPKGKTLPLLVDLLKKLNQERQAECIVFSNDNEACSLGVKSVKLPDMPEWLSPVCAVIPGQMFAYRLAEAKGHDVDHPEGLTKVTITR